MSQPIVPSLTPREPLPPAGGGLDGRLDRGRANERMACAWLAQRGYAIEAVNVRFAVGEIDIVAREGGLLCIVEVRSRAAGRLGTAAESVTWRKRRHMIKAAQWYLQRRRPAWTGSVRFDVVAIDYSAAGTPAIQLIQNAFTLDR